MMKNVSFFAALVTASGAAGTVSLFFPYAGGDTFLFAMAAFVLVLAGSFLLSALPEKKRFPLTALLFACLAAVLILFHSTLKDSFTAFSVPLFTTLKEPYDVDLALPHLPEGASPLAAEVYMVLFLSWFFLSAFLSKTGAVLSSLLSLAILLLGFYFGINPPPLALALAGAFMISLPARLKGNTLTHPEIPAFLAALLMGLVLSFVIPESRYEQPALFSKLQEEIVSFVDPYDPIFHAGNAYTGMMKGSAGRQKLGNVKGIRYSGRIIADIEAADQPHRLYLRSWTGGDYGSNQWKDLPDGRYESVAHLFEKNQGEWYDQGAWLMEVIARSPALSQSLSNYMKDDESVEGLKKDFNVDAVYEKTPFFLLPYDTSFGAPLFAYDRSPMSREGKAYSTYLWNLPASALLSMMEEENSSDPYFRTYLGAEKEYRRFVYNHYLAIPDSVKEGLAALGPLPPVKSLSEKRQRVEDIRRFLAENYRYTRSPGRTPEGKDFISYFLTESRKGYCTSFASAAVMLLRASGIPARYAVGLTVGKDEINGAPLSKDGLHQYSINDHHAHAWAEVYVDGLGWRPVEMTPGYEGTDNPFPIPEDKKRNDSGAPDAPMDEKDKNSPSRQEPQQKPQNRQEQPDSQKGEPSGNPPQLAPQNPGAPSSKPLPKGLLLLPLILAAAAAFILFRLSAVNRLIRRAPESKASFNRLLDYMDRLALYAGIPRKGSYEEQKKAFRKDKRFEGFDRLMDLLVKSRFSGVPLSKEEKEQAASLIAKARKNCLEEMGLWEKFRFLLIRKM
ncbi:transglutaminase family protein [uncultured Dialister sp.]|uniref:transglutaminase-like domain-containing protein n=1 Tax=uncultured Dialister sp. TaxID=278064 RepID=UPI0025EE12C1|nr:transglutaminase-like domain-containing protein [uncultured Dialister sp.]